MCRLCNTGLVEVWTEDARYALARGDDVCRGDTRNTVRVACTCEAGERWVKLKVRRYDPATMLRVDDSGDMRAQAAEFVPQLGVAFDPSQFQYPYKD